MTPKTPRRTRKPFGGYQISFAGRQETIEAVMGPADLAPHEMTKRLWAFVKTHQLATRRAG